MSGDERKDEAATAEGLPPSRAQRKLEAQETSWELANLFDQVLKRHIDWMRREPRQMSPNEMVKMSQARTELRKYAVGPDPEHGEMFEDPAYVARLKKEFEDFFGEGKTSEETRKEGDAPVANDEGLMTKPESMTNDEG